MMVRGRLLGMVQRRAFGSGWWRQLLDRLVPSTGSVGDRESDQYWKGPASANFVEEGQKTRFRELNDQIFQVVSTANSKVKVPDTQVIQLMSEIMANNDFQQKLKTDVNSKRLFHDFLLFIWDSETIIKNRSIMRQAFWICVKMGEFPQSSPAQFFLDYFERSLPDMSDSEVASLTSNLVDFYRECPQKETASIQFEYLETAIANHFCMRVDQKSPSYFAVTEVSLNMRRLRFSDQDFYDRMEKYLVDHLRPFNSQKCLALLDYLSSAEFQLQSKLAEEQLVSLAKLAQEHMLYFSEDELASLSMLFIRQLYHFQNFAFQELTEKVMERLFGKEDLGLSATKLVDLALLTNKRVSIEIYKRYFRRLDNYLCTKIKEVSPAQACDLLFLGTENDLKLTFRQEFFKRVKEGIEVLDLPHLVKIAYINSISENDEFVNARILEKLDVHLTRTVTGERVYLPADQLFPFLRYMSRKMKKETFELYERYIELHVEKMTFHTLAVALWSFATIVQLPRASVTKLVIQYSKLLTEYYAGLEEEPTETDSPKGRVQADKKQQQKTAVLPPTSWELFVILTSLCNFKFDERNEVIKRSLFVSTLVVSQTLDDFSVDEFVPIFKIYVMKTVYFEDLYKISEEFYDRLISHTEARIEEFPEKVLLQMQDILQKNEILKPKHKSLVKAVFLEVVRKQLYQRRRQQGDKADGGNFEQHI